MLVIFLIKHVVRIWVSLLRAFLSAILFRPTLNSLWFQVNAADVYPLFFHIPDALLYLGSPFSGFWPFIFSTSTRPISFFYSPLHTLFLFYQAHPQRNGVLRILNTVSVFTVRFDTSLLRCLLCFLFLFLHLKTLILSRKFFLVASGLESSSFGSVVPHGDDDDLSV